MSLPGYQAPVKIARRCVNERQERFGRRKAGRKGRGKNGCLDVRVFFWCVTSIHFLFQSGVTEVNRDQSIAYVEKLDGLFETGNDPENSSCSSTSGHQRFIDRQFEVS